MTNGRLAYDTGVSQGVQGDVSSIIGRLESLMATRDQQVATAMSDFQADGVSEEYHTVEQRWKSASTEVRSIIALIRETLAKNDDTAMTTQSRASTAVQNIG